MEIKCLTVNPFLIVGLMNPKWGHTWKMAELTAMLNEQFAETDRLEAIFKRNLEVLGVWLKKAKTSAPTVN